MGNALLRWAILVIGFMTIAAGAFTVHYFSMFGEWPWT